MPSRRLVSGLAIGLLAVTLGAFPGQRAGAATPTTPVEHPQVRVTTSMGDFVMELYPERAPVTVAEFLRYVKEGQYSQTLIHRVVPGFLVQGGGFSAVDESIKPTHGAVANESGNGLQNKHAKSDEWFNADKFPAIRYTSTKVTKTAGGYSSAGELEMHGVKKPLVIPFNFQKTSTGGLFTSTFMVSRVDYGVGAPGGEVDEKIKIELKVPVTAK